uniref:Uncharacterized protein n=1 Tax=Anopheles dirus TaxID=7168 RepID=A0A182NWF8_9DIPT
MVDLLCACFITRCQHARWIEDRVILVVVDVVVNHAGVLHCVRKLFAQFVLLVD